MDLLKKLTERAGSSPQSSFARDHVGLYLYGSLPGSEALGFRTRIATPMGLSAIEEMERPLAAGLPEVFLLRVEKSDRNTWARRISIGRATNNDLVLRHESVSKLHAHFMVRLEGGAETLVLADAGSANGTHVNGRAVRDGDDAALVVTSGDRLRFGDVEAQLLDASGLYQRLRRQQVASGDF